jgi:hypothetical protein
MNVKIRLCTNLAEVSEIEEENARKRNDGLVPDEVPELTYIFNPCILDSMDVCLPYVDESGNIQFWHQRISDWVVIEYDKLLWDEMSKKSGSYKVKGMSA